MKKIMALCESRHPFPAEVEGAVYPQNVDPLDIRGLRAMACDALVGVTELTLYVTGLTVALIEVLNVCKVLSIKLTLMHYNRETGEYYPQEVL